MPLHPPTSAHYVAPSLARVISRPLTWLWPQRIPTGTLTLLDAAPGSGASLLALTLAAYLTSGQPLPGDLAAAPPPPASVVLIAPHDDTATTILPRLQAAGGDPDRLFLLGTVPLEQPRPPIVSTTATAAVPSGVSPTATVAVPSGVSTVAAVPATASPAVPTERPFSLAEDLALLETTIIEQHAALVIIDPLHTALASSRRATVRSLLFSLSQLARRTGCAFLLIRPVPARSSPKRHLRLYPHPTGSPDLSSAARSGLLLTSDPANELTHLLVPTKSPLSVPPPPLAFQIIDAGNDVPVIHWLINWSPAITPASSHQPPNPAPSAQRQAILDCVLMSLVALSAQEIATRTGYAYTNVRQMLRRLCQEDELTYAARGLFTIPGHPCLLHMHFAGHTPYTESEGLIALDEDMRQAGELPDLDENTQQTDVANVSTDSHENRPPTDVSNVANPNTPNESTPPTHVANVANPSHENMQQTDVSNVANPPHENNQPTHVANVSNLPHENRWSLSRSIGPMESGSACHPEQSSLSS